MNYQPVDYYLNLPWTYTVSTEEFEGEKYFVVRVNEYPGISTDGRTIEEAFASVKEALTGVIEIAIKYGDEIPEPKKVV